MRPLRLFIAVLFLAAGIVIGALNAEPATLDLGIVKARAGLGVILLCTLLAGVICGALAIVVSVVMPLRRQVQRARAFAGPAPGPHPIVLSTEP